MQFDDNIKVKDALQIYFAQYHFKDGGYNDKYFKIKLGSFYIPLPNIKARLDAVKFHDLHHLVTEYTALYKGEAEIGAWEIAAGCGKYWAAWILNLGSVLIGLLFYQRPLLKAFLYGRNAKTSLYKTAIYNELLLNKTVGELRTEILPVANAKNNLSDYLLFIFWCVVALVYHLALAVIFILIIWKLFLLF
jgi:hypothetical protein